MKYNKITQAQRQFNRSFNEKQPGIVAWWMVFGFFVIVFINLANYLRSIFGG